MKAVTCRQYGPPEVLRIEDVSRPTPKADEVLVAVHSTSVTSGDARIRQFAGAGIFWLPMRLIFGVLRPRNPVTGMEFAGRVVAAGHDVSALRVGDAVFGMTVGRANAEYVAVRETAAVAVKPEALSFAEAAVTPFGALAALVFLRDFAKLKPGEKILIHGASGAVGVFAVQLAKRFGAHVTAVCSGANVKIVEDLGADKVIDYKTTDFCAMPEKYDVILDTVGGTSFSRSKHVLAPDGRHVFVVMDWPQIIQAIWTALRPGKRVICGVSRGDSNPDLLTIRQLIEAGLLKPVVDRTYGLESIAEAHRYVDSGRKRGGVVVSVAG